MYKKFVNYEAEAYVRLRVGTASGIQPSKVLQFLQLIYTTSIPVAYI
jgi:hypothetical protein